MGWLKYIWNAPWAKLSAILTVVIPIGGWLGNKLSDGWVLSALKTVWGWIKSFFLYEVALIWFIVFIAIALAARFLWIRFRTKTYPYQEYTKDKINGFNCEWSYDKKGNIVNIKIYCPTHNCNTPMRRSVDIYMDLLKCPRCSYRVNSYMNMSYNISDNDLNLVIRDNIRKKYGTK